MKKNRKVAPQHREREVFLRLRLARICLIKRKVVVDADKRISLGLRYEVHCVTDWGLSSGNEKGAFRCWYSRLNEPKSLVNVPFMALNATATKATKDKIFELLEFNCPVEGVENPNKNNIKYTEQLLDNNLPLVANFRSVIE